MFVPANAVNVAGLPNRDTPTKGVVNFHSFVREDSCMFRED